MANVVVADRMSGNTVRLSLKNNSNVGWVEERNPTFSGICWVTRMFNQTYKSSKPTQYWDEWGILPQLFAEIF
jgi:hypothetical protein